MTIIAIKVHHLFEYEQNKLCKITKVRLAESCLFALGKKWRASFDRLMFRFFFNFLNLKVSLTFMTHYVTQYNTLLSLSKQLTKRK